jgi:MFS family permease
VLLAIYLAAVLVSFCDGMLVPTLPVFVATFEVPIGVVGLVLAGEAIGLLVADLPAGWLARRMSAKGAMVLGISVVGTAVLATAVAPRLWQVFALRVVAGAGLALWNLARHAYLAGATRNGRRGRAIATFGGINRVGVFLGPAAGGVLASAAGLRAPFVAYAIVVLAAVVIVARFLPRLDAEEDVTAGLRSGELKHALRSVAGPLFAAGTAQLMAQMLRAGRKVLIPLYASQVVGLDVGAVGLVVSVSAFVDMALFYPAGWVMDRYGRKAAIVPSFLLQAVGMALVPFTSGIVGLMLAGVVIGAGNGLSSGTMMTLGADLAPRRAAYEFLAIWRLIGDSGMVGGPLLVGAVAQAAGLGASSLAVAAVGVGAAAWFLARVPETLRRAA